MMTPNVLSNDSNNNKDRKDSESSKVTKLPHSSVIDSNEQAFVIKDGKLIRLDKEINTMEHDNDNKTTRKKEKKPKKDKASTDDKKTTTNKDEKPKKKKKSQRAEEPLQEETLQVVNKKTKKSKSRKRSQKPVSDTEDENNNNDIVDSNDEPLLTIKESKRKKKKRRKTKQQHTKKKEDSLVEWSEFQVTDVADDTNPAISDSTLVTTNKASAIDPNALDPNEYDNFLLNFEMPTKASKRKTKSKRSLSKKKKSRKDMKSKESNAAVPDVVTGEDVETLSVLTDQTAKKTTKTPPDTNASATLLPDSPMLHSGYSASSGDSSFSFEPMEYLVAASGGTLLWSPKHRDDETDSDDEDTANFESFHNDSDNDDEFVTEALEQTETTSTTEGKKKKKPKRKKPKKKKKTSTLTTVDETDEALPSPETAPADVAQPPETTPAADEEEDEDEMEPMPHLVPLVALSSTVNPPPPTPNPPPDEVSSNPTIVSAFSHVMVPQTKRVHFVQPQRASTHNDNVTTAVVVEGGDDTTGRSYTSHHDEETGLLRASEVPSCAPSPPRRPSEDDADTELSSSLVRNPKYSASPYNDKSGQQPDDVEKDWITEFTNRPHWIRIILVATSTAAILLFLITCLSFLSRT